MRKTIFIFFTLLLSSGLSFGKTAVEDSGIDLVKSVMNRYQKAAAVEVNLKKTVTLALLDETNESQGKLLMSKGRMRLETEKPHESLIVMGQEAIWVVTPTPEELGGRTQVLKIKSGGKSQESRAPLAALLGKPSAWDEFKVTKETKGSEAVELVLAPKKPGALGEIISVELNIDPKEKSLNKLSYKDELDNITSFAFQKADFSVKASDQKFRYTPPKNAEVTEY